MDESDQDAVRHVLTQIGALRENGHFIFPSYQHCDTYVSEELIYPDIGKLYLIASFIVKAYHDQEVEVVLSDCDAAYALAQATAYLLSNAGSRTVIAVCAERDTNYNYSLHSSYARLIAGRRVLVVDGYAENAKCLKRLAKAARSHADVEVVGGAAVIANANVNTDRCELPSLARLLTLQQRAYPKHSCPYCSTKRTIDETVGHGDRYVREHGQP